LSKNENLKQLSKCLETAVKTGQKMAITTVVKYKYSEPKTVAPKLNIKVNIVP
jgi:hypothetical protein